MTAFASVPRFTGHLEPEHIALTDQLVEHWMGVGLSTERVDRDAAEQAVTAAYRAAGAEPAPITIWMDSPLGGALAAAVIRQLGDQLGGQLGDQLWDQLGGQWGAAVSPWRDAYWAALHVAARLSAALAPSPRLDSMAMAIGAVDHWWPMRGAVVLTDRPTVIARDGQGRLHSQTGPALAYSDGWTIHAVHGVRVPAEVIEHPEAITVDRILTAPNTEVRRVMIDLRGWDWFTAAAGLRLVDTADDPGNPGETITLWDLPEQVYDEPVRVVLVTNASPERDGTRRRYGLTVPADCDSAEGAVAWTFGIDADDYRSLARAT